MAHNKELSQQLLPMLDTLLELSETELLEFGITMEEVFMLEILADPVKWAREFLNWHARDYQLTILEQGAKRNRVVLRLGRRLGKTECMCILILWHAFTQMNRDPEKSKSDPYDILILTPAEKQSILIYDRLKELIEGSSELKGSISRDVFLRLELHNNTCIQLMTLGTGNGNGAASIRGQRADLLVYDEADFIGGDELANTMAIANEDKLRIKVLAASTPSGDRKHYYDWCVNASHSYDADIHRIENTGEAHFTYLNRPGRAGNGWTHVYAPSTVNKKLFDINPDTGMTGMEELREELTEMKFEQEVMANFGESEAGVYQKRHIDMAIAKGAEMKVQYASDLYGNAMNNFEKMGPRILGIDWDSHGAPTNMVGVQYVQKLGLFVPFLRVEVPQSDFTYDNAVKKVIALNHQFNFDWIYCDAGAGEAQIQFLRRYGMENPDTGLHHKVVRLNFSEKISTRDPFTMQEITQHIKPFMVNNLVRNFERGQVALEPNDRHFTKQLEDYHILRWGLDGRPVYTSENDHIHDGFLLAMHGFVVKYSDMLKVNTTVKIGKISNIDMNFAPTITRNTEEAPKKIDPYAGLAVIGNVGNRQRKSGRRGGRGRGMGMPTRSTF